MDVKRHGVCFSLVLILMLFVGSSALAAVKSDFLHLAHFGTAAQVRAALDRDFTKFDICDVGSDLV